MNTAARPPFGRIAFIVVMLALTALFVVLGLWQMQRLGEKQALLSMIEERLGTPPRPLPPAAEWSALEGEDYDYRPLTVAGHFLTEATVLVFTSLADPRGEHGGPGYWVMTPFALDGGGTIFVNRGFVPQPAAEDRAALEPMNPRTGNLELTGIGRLPEEASAFTPAPDAANRIDWIRDPARLAALANVEGPVAPVCLDLPAGAPGELPQGGETVVAFPNNHLGYALTWFGFAILTPILLLVWIRRQKSL
jgi:surfeit locus 1 family protein